jgi:hypothetical protein
MTHITIERAKLEQWLATVDEATTYTSGFSSSPSMTKECKDLCNEIKQALAAPVQELHKENPYYPATHIGQGWQDGFDGKALASTLEPYTRGYAEGKADARAIEQSHGITKGQQ